MTPLLKKYREYLPLSGISEISDLGEGGTPLVNSRFVQRRGNLFFKMEQLNPTGSFKDRFAAVEATLIKQAGIDAFLATSSGNTGSALAAYSARQGLRCLLFVNEHTPESKLTQMLAYELSAETSLAFEADGLRCTIRLPLSERIARIAEP